MPAFLRGAARRGADSPVRSGETDAAGAIPSRRRRPGPLARAAARLDTTGGAALTVTLLAFLAFSPWWAGGRFFAPLDLLDEVYEPWTGGDTRVEAHNHFTSDAVTQYLVYRKFAERSFAEDGFIGWSDLTAGGRPEYANTMAAYDDWSMQLHRFLDFWTAWHVGLLGQFLVAALGMLALLRSQGISPLAGALGAIAYAANSQFVLTVYHRWHLGGFAWVPWIVWAMHRHRAGRAWAWPLVPGFLALAFLGGNLQTSVFVAIVVAAVWLGWLGECPAGARARRRITGTIAVWSALGAGLAAFSLLPAIAAFLETMEIGLDRGRIGYRHGAMQPVLSALFIPVQLVPSLLGSPRSIDLAKALKLDLAYVAYFGFLPTLIAYRSAFLRGVPAAARWAIAFGLLLPLTPLVGPLYHRVQLVFAFGGAWAFAWYWDHADRRAVDPVLRGAAYVFAGCAGLWLLGSIATVVFEDRLVALLQAEVAGRMADGRAGTLAAFTGWMLDRAARLVSELRIWSPRQAIAVATAAAGFAALRLRTRAGARRASALLLAAIVLDLGAFAAGWVTVVDPERHPPYAVTDDIAAMQERVGRGRVFVVQEEDRPTIFFPSNTLAAYGIASIQAYETIALHGMWEALGYATDAASLGRLAVTHAVSMPGRALPEGWTAEYRGERLILWRNERALPRYLALGAGAPEWLRRLAPAAVSPLPDPPVAGAVRVVAATQNRRVLEAPAGAHAVRVAENWSEGWRFRVDGGAWRPAARAADRSMAIPLAPAPGPVRIELVYRPSRRMAGGRLTLLAALAVAAGSGMAVRARRGGGASGAAPPERLAGAEPGGEPRGETLNTSGIHARSRRPG